MGTEATNRQHSKNLNMSRKLKATLTGFYYAGLLETWHRKAIFIYWMALLFCAADRDLIKGCWKRPNTFPPIPIEVTSSISRALTWMLNSALKFELQHKDRIAEAVAQREEEVRQMDASHNDAQMV